MNDRYLPSDRYDLRLGSELPKEALDELRSIVEQGVEAAEATKPRKAKYRLAEFPDEVKAELVNDIQRDSANNAEREAERQQNPPPPDQLAKEQMILEAKVREAARVAAEMCGHLVIKIDVPVQQEA